MEDRGFGTAYEKHLIGKIFAGYVQDYHIKTVCEFPSNDLMGNNSSEFEALGCAVTRLPLSMADSPQTYDFVWCFCEFEQQDDPIKLMQKAFDKSNKYVMIVTQNRRNIGVPLHYLYHFITRRKWDHGQYKYMTTAWIEKNLPKDHVIIERGAFDAPWFILDVYEAGSLLLRLIPKSLLGGKISQSDIKPSFWEKMPYRRKKWLSHHLYLLIEKR